MRKRDFLKKFIVFALATSLLIPHNSFALKTDFNNLFSKQKLNNRNIDDEFNSILLKYAKEDKEKVLTLIVQINENSNYKKVLNKIRRIPSVKINFEYKEIFAGASLDIKLKDLVKLASIDDLIFIEESKEIKPQMLTTHELVNSLKLSNKYQNDGRGMVIALVDSGIDTRHKDLRLDEGVEPKIKTITKSIEGEYTLKVPHGFNYVGGNHKLIDETEYPHGMHIAGILVGNATDEDVENNRGIDGIAPNAQLLMYRVFSDRADTQVGVIDDKVFAAIEDAIKHEADVISLSIGDYGTGKPGDAFYKAVERAKKKGIVVVASMGNASTSSSSTSYDKHTNDAFDMKDYATTVSVAANTNVIGVGSTRNKYKIDLKARLNDYEFFYRAVSYSKFEDKEYEFVDALGGTSQDIENLDLNGKVAIVSRSKDGHKNQFDRLREKGAVGVISYNDSTGRNRDFYEEEMHDILYENVAVDLWGLTTSNNDGKKILEIIRENPVRRLTSLGVLYSKISDEHEISGFTSWGGTIDLELKPDLVAPGERIYSTLNHNRYGVMSGTSMSTPVVAGASAILLKRFRELERPEDIDITEFTKIMMMNTATPLFDTTGFENSPRQQGAGMLNIEAAYENNVLLTYENKGAVTLKEIGDEVNFEIKLKNLSNEEERFTLDKSKVLTTAHTEVSKNGEIIKEVHSTQIDGASLESEVSEVVLGALEEKTLSFTLRTSNLSNQFVEGYIYLKSETNPNLAIPYFGFRGNWHDERIIDAPIFEENSKTKLTAIMSNNVTGIEHGKYIILGLRDVKNLDSGVDANRVAISSKSNKRVFGGAMLRLAVLRDLQEYIIDVTTEMSEDAKSLRRIQTGNFLERFRYVDYFENDIVSKKYKSPNEKFYWDGTFYDKKTSGVKEAEEGQYYIRIRVKNDLSRPYQTTYLPIKIDNTYPTFSINKEADSYKIEANDNYGIWYVRAYLDEKEVDVEKIDENNYKISNLELSAVKDNELKIEVVDIAGNKVEEKLIAKESYIKFDNLEEVETRRRSTTLEASIKEEVVSYSATLNGRDIDIEKVSSGLEFDLTGIKDGTSTLHIVLKDANEEVLYEGDTIIKRDVTAPKVVYDIEMDEEDEYPLITDGYVTIKGSVSDSVTRAENIKILYYLRKDRLNNAEKKVAKVNEDGSFEFKVYLSDFKDHVVVDFIDEAKRVNSRTFNLAESEGIEIPDRPITMHTLNTYFFLKEENLEDNLHEREDGTYYYNLKFTAYDAGYSIKINDDEPKEIDEDTGLVCEINLVEGPNLVDIEGYDSNNKLVFQRKLTFLVDLHTPIYEIENFRPMPRLEDETHAEIQGTLYLKDSEYTLSGYAEDNGLGWTLLINRDRVKEGKAFREFGQNREYFSYTTDVEDDDILWFRLVDFHGNEVGGENLKYRIKIDTEKPVVMSDINSLYKKEASIRVDVTDNLNLYETRYTLNDELFNIADKITEPGEYKLNIVAEDAAGNETRKTNYFRILDDLNATLTKDSLREKDIEDTSKYLELSYGTMARLIENKVEEDKIKLKVLLYNELDDEEIVEYEVDLDKTKEARDSFYSGARDYIVDRGSKAPSKEPELTKEVKEDENVVSEETKAETEKEESPEITKPEVKKEVSNKVPLKKKDLKVTNTKGVVEKTLEDAKENQESDNVEEEKEETKELKQEETELEKETETKEDTEEISEETNEEIVVEKEEDLSKNNKFDISKYKFLIMGSSVILVLLAILLLILKRRKRD